MKNIYPFLLFFLTSPLFGQIQLLNDEFDNAATYDANWFNINEVEQWDAEQLEAGDINTSTTSSLHMMPWTSSWFQDYKGTLIFKEVDQDFIFTTQVSSTNRAEDDMPGSLYSLGGVMLRMAIDYPDGATAPGAWGADAENYIFLAAGFASTSHPSCNGCPGPHFEVKTTTNGASNLQVSSIATYENIGIRVARIGTAILILYQEENGDWVVHQKYSRSDFPDTLQVGFVTYTDWSKVSTYDPYFHNSHVLNDNLNPDPSSNPGLAFDPDLIGKFEFGRFDDVELPPDLENVDLVNDATDEDILGFMGYESVAFCPQSILVTDDIINGSISSISADTIIVEHTIDGTSSMEYSATDIIEFLHGFSIEIGGEMVCTIGGCGN